MPLHPSLPPALPHTFNFGLGLRQSILELLLEEESLQSLLVVVDPVTGRATSQGHRHQPQPPALAPSGPATSFPFPAPTLSPQRPPQPAHLIEEAVGAGHALQLVFVLLQEVNVTLLWDELEELRTAGASQTRTRTR